MCFKPALSDLFLTPDNILNKLYNLSSGFLPLWQSCFRALYRYSLLNIQISLFSSDLPPLYSPTGLRRSQNLQFGSGSRETVLLSTTDQSCLLLLPSWGVEEKGEVKKQKDFHCLAGAILHGHRCPLWDKSSYASWLSHSGERGTFLCSSENPSPRTGDLPCFPAPSRGCYILLLTIRESSLALAQTDSYPTKTVFLGRVFSRWFHLL